MSRRASLGIAVGLLLAYFAARLIALAAFPPFVDESTHIEYGRVVLASGPLARAEEGRQFLIWWYILFGAQVNAALWIARAATLIALLPGFAAVLGAARLLSNRWGAIFAALLLIFSPYHAFFERLALGDPISASAVMGAFYFACRLKIRAVDTDAAQCGILLFAACGLKISALPYFVIPLVALITLRRSRAGLRWTVVALLVGLGLTGAFLGLLYWRGYNPLFHLETTSTISRSQTLLTNIASSVDTLFGYLGIPAAALLVLGMTALLVRKRFFVVMCFIVPLGVIWLNPSLESRHLIAPMTLLLLGSAVVLGDLVGRYAGLRSVALAGVIVGGLLWLPFAWTMANAPSILALPADDRAEYVTSEGSGFGLTDIIAALKERRPTRVIGVLANCLSLRDLAPFPVECPRLNPNGEDVQALNDLMESSRAPGVYAVLEAIPYAPPSAPGTVVAVVKAGRPSLTIYNLAP